jgi:hypothetical protein
MALSVQTRERESERERESCVSIATLHPDLSPGDIFLFPKLKVNLKGRRFKSAGEMKLKTESNKPNFLKVVHGSPVKMKM